MLLAWTQDLTHSGDGHQNGSPLISQLPLSFAVTVK